MTYSEMTDDQRLEWGREELAARKADLSLRTAEGLRDAKQRADARRRAIGASKSAAASMVAEATRELRWAAYRTTASQPDAGPQAPIIRVSVDEFGSARVVTLYAPGLPPGEYDLYCEPEATAPMLRAADNAAAQPDAGRAYHETHEPPHCPTCECGADNAAAQPDAAP